MLFFFQEKNIGQNYFDLTKKIRFWIKNCMVDT